MVRKSSTPRIAERASFSIGTLYQYFGDKDAIIAALSERERDKVLATVAKALSSVEPADAQNVIREIVRTMIGSFSKRRRARRMVMITMLKRWQFAPDKQSAGVIEQMIVDSGGRGHGRVMSPAAAFVLTRAFMGAIRAAVLRTRRISRRRNSRTRWCISCCSLESRANDRADPRLREGRIHRQPA